MVYTETTLEIPDTYSKVAVCDLEGTLTESDLVWMALHETYDVPFDESKALYERFIAGEFSQEAYRERIVDLWHERDEPPTRERMEAVMADHIEIHPDADDFIATLQEENYYTVIASGAPDTYSGLAVDELGLDGTGTDVSTIQAVYTSTETEENVLERFDWTQYKSSKETLIEQIREQHVNKIVAVGNAGNDIGMVKAADHAYMVPSATLDYDTLEEEIPHMTVAPLEEITTLLNGGGENE